MSSHSCNGPRLDDSGSLYCPFAPELDEWDCDDCKRGQDWAVDVAIDYMRERDGCWE